MSALYQLLSRVSAYYWLKKTQLIDRHFYGAIGDTTKIINPLKVRNPQNIYIGRDVCIANQAWLFTQPVLQNRVPRLVIGDSCEIGHFNHITCIDSVELEAKVLTADRVHISDNTHSFEDPTIPIVDQPVISKGPVKIGRGTWVGENVSILSCKIGRNCVIGANAVVTKDMPDFCVIAGVPGRIIKQFNVDSQKWEKVS